MNTPIIPVTVFCSVCGSELKFEIDTNTEGVEVQLEPCRECLNESYVGMLSKVYSDLEEIKKKLKVK